MTPTRSVILRAKVGKITLEDPGSKGRVGEKLGGFTSCSPYEAQLSSVMDGSINVGDSLWACNPDVPASSSLPCSVRSKPPSSSAVLDPDQHHMLTIQYLNSFLFLCLGSFSSPFGVGCQWR